MRHLFLALIILCLPSVAMASLCSWANWFQPKCYCSDNTMNCADFGSQFIAQFTYECCLNEVGYDVHRIDGDSDGKACEALQ